MLFHPAVRRLSGGMDVVMGAAECFGISLDQNFKRPYFARSISDFWHRWHITLGTWMKGLCVLSIFPVQGMNRLVNTARRISAGMPGGCFRCVSANLLGVFLVGDGMGQPGNILFYGLYNGVIIAAGNLSALCTRRRPWHSTSHKNPKPGAWSRLQRTFLLVNISWYFDMAQDLKASFIMMKNTVTGFFLLTPPLRTEP